MPERYDATVGLVGPEAETDQQQTSGQRWVNMGSNVLIDDNGTILEGCPGLKGHEIDELDETREFREQKQDDAERRGISGHDIDLQDAEESDGDWGHLQPEGRGNPEDMGFHEGMTWEDEQSPQDAGARALEQAPDGPLKQFVGSLQKMRDVRRDGVGTTSEVHPDHARRIYDILQVMGAGGDGFGDVYDLGGQLGAGAIGYHSPAGELVMVPPQTKNGDWEVRYALPDVEQTWKPDIIGDTGDAKNGDGDGDWWEDSNAPTTRYLEDAMDEVGILDPESREVFRWVVDDTWKAEFDRVNEQNDLFRNLVGYIYGGEPAKRAAFTRKIRAAQDPDEIKGFDELVQVAESTFPQIFSGYGEQFGSADPEWVVFDTLKRGIQAPPAKHHQDVIAKALDNFAAVEKQIEAQKGKSSNEDWDPYTFRRSGQAEKYRRMASSIPPDASPAQGRVWRDRAQLYRAKYAKELGQSQRWEAYAKGIQATLWDESDHPRNPAGTSQGGQFRARREGEGRAGLTVSEAMEKATDGKKRERLTYDEAVKATLIYTGTNSSDWSAVSISDVVEIDEHGGQTMPVFEFPTNYSEAVTPFKGDSDNPCCELCGHTIKKVYWIQNDADKLTMRVGSECVTRFGDGTSGAKLEKAARDRMNADLLREAWAARNDLAERFGVQVWKQGTRGDRQFVGHSVHDARNSIGIGNVWRKMQWNDGRTAKMRPTTDEERAEYEKAKEIAGTIGGLDSLLFTGKRPFHPDGMQWVSGNHDPASPGTITRIVNQHGDRLRELVAEADRLLGRSAEKYARGSQGMLFGNDLFGDQSTWLEDQHPREPAGTKKGGQFASKKRPEIIRKEEDLQADRDAPSGPTGAERWADAMAKADAGDLDGASVLSMTEDEYAAWRVRTLEKQARKDWDRFLGPYVEEMEKRGSEFSGARLDEIESRRGFKAAVKRWAPSWLNHPSEYSSANNLKSLIEAVEKAKEDPTKPWFLGESNIYQDRHDDIRKAIQNGEEPTDAFIVDNWYLDIDELKPYREKGYTAMQIEDSEKMKRRPSYRKRAERLTAHMEDIHGELEPLRELAADWESWESQPEHVTFSEKRKELEAEVSRLSKEHFADPANMSSEAALEKFKSDVMAVNDQITELARADLENAQKHKEKLWLMLGNGTPDTAPTSTDEFKPMKGEMARAKAFLDIMVGDVHDGKRHEYTIKHVEEGAKYGTRCYAKKTDIYVTSNTGATTIVHEVGHTIEHAHDDRIGEVSKAFLVSQTRDEKTQHLGDGYDPDEVATEDGFMRPYTGKFYHGAGSTEILSMGMQHLFEDASKFAKESPDHFRYTLAVLRGLI